MFERTRLVVSTLLFLSVSLLSLNVADTVEKDFKVFWNVPTFQCRTHKILFDDILDKYKILHNSNVDFRGETIVILYDPGMFPALLTNGSQTHFRNGGLPQNGNISLHKVAFKTSIETLVPANFSGIGIIDFESWRPVFRQNFGTLIPYKDISMAEEKKRHPLWPDTLIRKEATRRFELAAMKFMEQTLRWISEYRPEASWGYYAYPYCYNMAPNNMNVNCSEQVRNENDKLINWLFKNSDNMYPSIYFSENQLTLAEKILLIEGRVDESNRISKTLGQRKKIFPYFWYKYRDTDNFLSEEDLFYVFFVLKALDTDGFIIWGSSNDVNSKEKCQLLYDYVDSNLGPILLAV